MSRVEVWETLPSFEMWPEKTFFGLDKGAAHCFTLPKQMTDPMIRFFGLREGKLQVPIMFVIQGREYPAIVRWARLDRRNPTKLNKEDLPKRDIIQFSWKGNEITISAIRIALQDAFSAVINGSKNKIQSAIFVHTKENEFCIYSNQH